MSVVSMKKLLESGAHFGHQTRRWNPKMKPYIYAAKNGIYILNLDISLVKMDEAYAAMKDIAEKGGKVLFVGTKKQAQATVMEEALRSGSFYVNQRWLGGILTNYRTIQKRIRRLLEIEEMEANGSINIYPKKEVAQLRKEALRLENFLGGIKEMKKVPDAVFVVDPIEDHIAVAEARKLKIPVFGIVDTNTDPESVDYVIPANDDAVKSIKLVVGLMADAIVESKGGLLTTAYQDDLTDDITMSDVLQNVIQQNEENERRRRARNDERRNQQNTRRPYPARRNEPRREYESNRPTDRKSFENRAVEAKPVENKPVEAKPVEAKPVEVKPVEVKPVETKVTEVKPVEKKEVAKKPVEKKEVKAEKVANEETEKKPVKRVKKVEEKATEEVVEKVAKTTKKTKTTE